MQPLKTLSNGIFKDNPTFIALLGITPALAITTSMQNALSMGIATTIVLILSNIVISLLRKIIPENIRFVSYAIIVSGFVALIEMLLSVFFLDIAQSLGIFVPLIVVNGIVLGRAEQFAALNSPLRSALDGLGTGLGFIAALVVVAIFREILGAGTIMSFPLFGDYFMPARILLMPPGAFIVLGILLAIVAKFRTRGKLRGAEQNG